MSQKSPYFFVSYSRKDTEVVRAVASELTKRNIAIWMDSTSLNVGENWADTIFRSLEQAAGLIIFLSAASLESPWVLHELQAALKRQARIFPVLLEQVKLPVGLANIQYVDLRDPENFQQSIDRLAYALQASLQGQEKSTGLEEKELKEFARNATNVARGEEGTKDADQIPNSVFIVHGRDMQFRDDVENYLIATGVKPIVLSKMPNAHRSLFDKFFSLSEDTQFAIVLISADDYGLLADEFNDPQIGDRALQYRARQNVILELGFFYGKLTFERVFVLYKQPSVRFPKFERPSDLEGVLWDEYDSSGKWKDILKNRLKDHGFNVP